MDNDIIVNEQSRAGCINTPDHPIPHSVFTGAHQQITQKFRIMKTITIAMLALIVGTGYAQTDCKPYVPTSEGTKWEITNYSAKGKATGKVAYELVEKLETSGNLTFTIKAISYDKKGKEAFQNTYEAYCVNGKFNFDMAFKMDGEAMQAYESMDVDVDASDYEIPSMDAAPGTTLKDGTLTVEVGSGSVPVFKMTVLITDRKVESIEDKKTPAGTFKCIMLSQKFSTKMIVKVEGSSKEWYSEEVGMVRSESYSKNGNLNGYSELTKLEKK